MTANELAEKIQFDVEPYIETDQFIFDECANMLRQQQAEIEAQKADAKKWFLKYQECFVHGIKKFK